MNKHYLLPAGILLAATFLGSGCEHSQNPARTAQTVIKRYSKSVTLEGTVSTGRLLIKTGVVEVIDESGKKINDATVKDGRFKAEITAGTPLPLLLNFSSDKHPEKLVSVVINENITKYFIDPSTTAIANAAKAMGGYTHANLVRAAEDSTHVPDANKTTGGWRGDPTTQYGGWH